MGRKTTLIVLMIVFLSFSFGRTYAENRPEIALLSVNNYCGVEKIRGTELSAKVEEIFINEIKKQKSIDIIDYNQTKALLKKNKLDLYYEAQNLCTDDDVAEIGNLIGLPYLAIIEINGYNEIKKERSKKSYELLLGLKVYDCIEKTTHFYTGEGFSEKNRTEAFENAVTLLIHNYLDLKEDDPNTGHIRAANVEVMGNRKSLIYHLVDCQHLPYPEDQMYFTTRTEAEDYNFAPCPICFPPYSSFNYYDRNIEENLGVQACGMIEYNYRMGNDPAALKRIEEVAAPIIANTGRKNFEYNFRLLDTNEVNAFAAPNGYIYVTKGLLNIIESDEELSFVLAHEIGHLEKKHAVLSYKKALGLAIFTTILAIGTQTNDSSSDDSAALIATVMGAIIQQGYSREQEKEADEVALAHLKKLGLDHQVYKVLMGKFIDMRKRKIYFIEKIFSTHPSPEKRIEHLDSYIKAYDELRSLMAS